jgi:capsular exopolysaccharide synthesis family protein
MDKKDRRKFRLGDIIQRLNEEKAVSGEKLRDEAEPPPKVRQSPQAVPEDRGVPSGPAQSPLDVTETGGPVQPQPRYQPGTEKKFPSPATVRSGDVSSTSRQEQSAPASRPAENQNAATAVGPQPPAESPVTQKAPAFESDLADNPEESTFDVMRYIGVILRRRNIIIASAIIVGLFSLYGYIRAGKFYSAHARMLFSPGYQDIMGNNANLDVWQNEDQRFNTHLELLKSVTVIKRVSEDLGNKIEPGEIASALTISRGETGGEKNDIIDIVTKNSDPHTAQDIANQLCKTYTEYMKEVNVQDITHLLVNLEDQIGKVQAELDQKENILRVFKEKNHTVQLSSETNITVNKLSQLELELQKTELDMLESRERFTGINKQIGQQDINVIQSMTYSNPFQAKLAELELELNSLSAEYSPEHFKVKMIKGQIDKIKEAMKTDITREAASRTLIKNPIREGLLQDLVNLSIEKSALEAKRTAQEQLIKQLDVELSKLPTVELQFAQLTRETESLVEVLKLLKSRFEEARIKRDSQQSDLKILEWAQLPIAGVSSVPFSKVLIGLLIGIVIGIALAFGLEFLDQSIKDPQSIERTLELPLLGIVPMIEMEKAIIENAKEKWRTVLEPFRALRATLKHLATAQQFKTLIICSAVKGEGKTTLAANLAITFSLDGKKVILVDGDLRRAQMHSLFNVPKYCGLSDYLLGDKELNEIIKPTVHENLFVITAGEHPQNPSELIGNARFEQLVKSLRPMADFIIFDSPALLPVSDGMIMAPKIDACIMVVRALWTPMKAAQQAKNQLKRIGCNIIGGILNGISHSRGYYPYYYGYYRYYAYKYTYEEDHDRERRRFTIRELGLKAENALKTFLRTTFFSLPQYNARTRGFIRHLFRQKLFWLLVVLLCAIPVCFAVLKFLGIGKNPRDIVYMGNPDTIQYLGGASSSTPSSAMQEASNESLTRNGTSLEQIAVGRPLPPQTRDSIPARKAADSVAQKSGPDFSHDHAEVNTNAHFLSLLSDSLRLWQQSFNAGNIERFLSFYDLLRFKFPGGSYQQWESVNRALFKKQTTATSFVLDSIWSSPVAFPFFQTDFSVSLISPGDTLHRTYTTIWQNSNNQWRIIREKYKEQP